MRLFSPHILKLTKSGIPAMFILLVVMGAFMEIFLMTYYPHFIQQSFSISGVEFKAFSDIYLLKKIESPNCSPCCSSYSPPEVGVTDVAFMNRIGLWGREQVVLFNILSTVEQRITIAVEAINYTALLQGREQVLASKTLQINVTIGENKGWAALKVDGGGWTYVAPRVRIIGYQDDVYPDNNDRVGPAIPFSPVVDLHVTLYVYLAEYKVPARYPELTKYHVNLEIISDYDLPGVGIAEINYTWVSAYTMQTEVVSRSWEVTIKRGVNWINDTFTLPWTDVVVIRASFRHPYEIMWADNYQEYHLQLDEAVKILNVTHPLTVLSGSTFNITVWVLSNKKVEHPIFAYIDHYAGPSKFVTIPFGISKWNITIRAPQLRQDSPQQHVMVVGVGADFYSKDNEYQAYLTIIPEISESEDFKHKNGSTQALLIVVSLILMMIACFAYILYKKRRGAANIIDM